MDPEEEKRARCHVALHGSSMNNNDGHIVGAQSIMPVNTNWVLSVHRPCAKLSTWIVPLNLHMKPYKELSLVWQSGLSPQ